MWNPEKKSPAKRIERGYLGVILETAKVEHEQTRLLSRLEPKNRIDNEGKESYA